MTEKEKASKGLLYDANNDPDLLSEMTKANNLLFLYNNEHPQHTKERDEIVRKLLGQVGNEVTIRSPFFCDYGYNINIGDHFFSNVNLVILDGAKVTIGNNVFIAPNVSIYTAGHPFEVELRNKGLEYAYPVTIGDNVWIGGNAVILPGISIGDNAVIGAGSVVNRDIPANCLAVGNPCRIVREINKNDTAK